MHLQKGAVIYAAVIAKQLPPSGFGPTAMIEPCIEY